MHSTPVVDGREASRLITQGRAGAADGSDVLGDGGSLDILACGFAAMSKPGLAVTGNMGQVRVWLGFRKKSVCEGHSVMSNSLQPHGL